MAEHRERRRPAWHPHVELKRPVAPPSGKRASFDFAGVARIEDGRFTEWWITWDNMTILGQLGHLPGA